MVGYDKERYYYAQDRYYPVCYHVIDTPIYYDFVWISEELPQYSNAVLNPYVAWAFVPISGKYVYTAQALPWGEEQVAEIRGFMAAGARDTSWLMERNVDLIYVDINYSPQHFQNPDLVEVRNKVYIVRKEGN